MRASVLIPTRDRAGYLAVALRSVAPQAPAEIVVVQDGPHDAAVAAVCAEAGARYLTLGESRGPNAARNAAIAAAEGDLLVFLDDDVEVWPGWLDALVAGAAAEPQVDVFGGPIRPRLEGIDIHPCGREQLPVTTLDRGPHDRDVEFVWSANMAVRRAAFERVGGFDEGQAIYGDEEEWLRRLGGRVRYVAAAGVDHRRAGADATWRALIRAAWFRGRQSRRYDERKGTMPGLAGELRTLLGSAWHSVRRRCGNGVLLTALSAGRFVEALSRKPPAPGPDYLSGQSGTLSRRTALLGLVRDALAELHAAPARRLLRPTARRSPRRRVLAVCVARPENAARAQAAARELRRSRHEVELRLVEPEPGRGRWANVATALGGDADWVVVFDDDVALPRGFLDAFLVCAERLDLRLAQPAHAYRSHAAWPVTRRRPGLVARTTRFVEQGPVLALERTAAEALLPPPPLQMGWGLDSHWSALAGERGWAIGIVDATPVRHLVPVATDYPRAGALAEAEAFLADRPYVRRDQATTIRGYRRLPTARAAARA